MQERGGCNDDAGGRQNDRWDEGHAGSLAGAAAHLFGSGGES